MEDKERSELKILLYHVFGCTSCSSACLLKVPEASEMPRQELTASVTNNIASIGVTGQSLDSALGSLTGFFIQCVVDLWTSRYSPL